MPYGMVLITGPTGSGKTTSLYAAISEINHGSDKIITIEDPVEYQLPGVLQIPVNEKKGLTFARGLRSILRHDPDKIMVGEIRDSDYSFVSALNIVVAQRLLRVVCPQCASPVNADNYPDIQVPENAKLMHGKGCGACRGTGYKGRHAVAEILHFDDALRELIANRASIKEIKAYAANHGTKFLHQAALEMAFAGQTTLEEVQRVAPKV